MLACEWRVTWSGATPTKTAGRLMAHHDAYAATHPAMRVQTDPHASVILPHTGTACAHLEAGSTCVVLLPLLIIRPQASGFSRSAQVPVYGPYQDPTHIKYSASGCPVLVLGPPLSQA